MKKIDNVIFILFLLLAILIGYHHEPWVDEAQSWIIARDAGVKEIIWDISRYEGTFPLWFLTLKLFIICGLEYRYLFIVSVIISAIGLWIFLKKVDCPIYFKILFPFTYYIFYQYTIVARSYCYLLLAFSLWAIAYKDRFNYPLKYILSLIFFSFISMHGMIISGIFGITFFIEVLKQKELKKKLKYFILICIIWIIECIILCPRNDLYMTVSAVFSIKEIFLSLVNVIIGNGNIIKKIYNFISLLLFLILLFNIILLKNKDISIVTAIVFAFMFIIRLCNHHLGILFLIVMFGIICNYDEIKNRNKYNEKIIFGVLILYSVFSFYTGINDIIYPYSGSKEMAEYIKNMGYEEEEIYGFGYKDVSLEPYFNEALYKNWTETIYRWSSNNIDFYNYCNFENIDKSQFDVTPKYIIIEWDDSASKLNLIRNYIENSGKYEIEYQTMGYEFFKNSYSELEGYTLYRLKE